MKKLIAACGRGVEKHTRVSTRDIYNERLDELIGQHFTPHDQASLEAIRARGHSGLLAARARDREVARTHFAACEQLLEKHGLSRRARVMAESILLPQTAYARYTDGRYDDAVELLQQALINDLILEADLRFAILAIGRVQLVNNWMRIEITRQNWPRALALGIMKLQYLEAPETNPLQTLPAPWNQGWHSHHDGIPADLIWKMHAQIAAETVVLFDDMMANLATASEVTGVIGNAIRPDAAETQVGRWLAFQEARLASSADECCLAASVVLGHGSVPSAPLWLSVAHCTQTLLCAAAETEEDAEEA